MDAENLQADRFEAHRPHLQRVAYRMLGTLTEAEDAVQECWLRFSRADTTAIENDGAWLTTVVSRICLNVLRSRRTRPEDPVDPQLPDPLIALDDDVGPERQAVIFDTIGLALLVVLDTLAPAERVSFVLHDMFAVPFDEIAPVIGRSTEATRQLASRARRRVQDVPMPDSDITRQREVVEAFFAAAHGGDFEALVAVLDPDVELRSDAFVRLGATAVARSATAYADPRRLLQPVVINGVPGVVVTLDGDVTAVMAFTVVGDKIVRVHAYTDPQRLARITRRV
jgi:RNA polymerase sigma-70 factor (ECF subfamily)